MRRKSHTQIKRPGNTKRMTKASKRVKKIKALAKKEKRTPNQRGLKKKPIQPIEEDLRTPKHLHHKSGPKMLPKKRKSKNYYRLNSDQSVEKLQIRPSRPKNVPRKKRPKRSQVDEPSESDSFHSARSSLNSYKDARTSLSSAKSKGNRNDEINQNAFVPEGVSSLKRRRISKELYDRNGDNDNMKVFELKGDVLDEYFADNYREMHKFKPNVLVCRKKDNLTQKFLVKFEDNTSYNAYLSSDHSIIITKEMYALSALESSKLVPEIEEFVRDSKRSMLVTKFDDAFEDLAVYLIRESRNITYYDVDKFMHVIVMGIIKMNRLGVYHGDIKLDNILINKEHKVMFIDFDFCYFDRKRAVAYMDPSTNKPVPYHDQIGDKIISTERSGTAQYTSPEILFNAYKQSYDVIKKQVYEIGAIYHYIITSEPIYYFYPETAQIILNKSPTLSNKQSAIIDVCTDSDPSKRADLVDLAKYFLHIDAQYDAQNYP